MQDAFGNSVSCTSSSAICAYDQAVDAHLHAWPGARSACDEAIQADPDFALPYALNALGLAAYGRVLEARGTLAQALEKNATTAREQSFLALIQAILDGNTAQALAAVREHAGRYPNDALAASTALGAYGLFAFSGRADHDVARRDFLEALVPHYPQDFPWLLSNRGWARIECGDADEGLAMTLAAIAKRPNNAHSAHHVMHGYFELRREREALAFVDGWLTSYPENGLMWGHLHWHGALAELALGLDDAAVRRLLGPIIGYLPRGTPFMGLADVASLLWRMGLQHMRPLPWGEAHRHAGEHFTRGSNPFGELHLVMLAAVRRDRPALDAAAQRLQAAIERGHQGAIPVHCWAKAMQALLDSDQTAAKAHMDACARVVVQIGGSHAQRSIVDATLDTLAIPATD